MVGLGLLIFLIRCLVKPLRLGSRGASACVVYYGWLFRAMIVRLRCFGVSYPGVVLGVCVQLVVSLFSSVGWCGWSFLVVLAVVGRVGVL